MYVLSEGRPSSLPFTAHRGGTALGCAKRCKVGNVARQSEVERQCGGELHAL